MYCESLGDVKHVNQYSNLCPLPLADKCLSNGALQKQTKQASIFKFAVPKQTPRNLSWQHNPASRADAALAARAAAAAGEILDMTSAAAKGQSSMAASRSIPCKVHAADTQQQGSAATVSTLANASNHSSNRQRQQKRTQLAALQSPSVSWSSESSQDSQQKQQQEREEEEEEEQQQPQHRMRLAAAGGSTQPQAPRPLQPQLASPKPIRRQAPAAPLGSLLCFSCAVVGRRFLKHDAHCQTGQVGAAQLACSVLQSMRCTPSSVCSLLARFQRAWPRCPCLSNCPILFPPLMPQRLVVEPEADNPRDANALLVLDSG